MSFEAFVRTTFARFGLPAWPFVLLGFVAVAAWFSSFLRNILLGLRSILLGPSFPFERIKGHWAVVTGATDGIGLEYVKQLASRDLNIVLISRSREKLDEVAMLINKQFPKISTKIIVTDFCDADYTAVEKELEGLRISVLVNNVGMLGPLFEHFTEQSRNVLVDVMRCNMFSAVFMTHIILPKIIEHKLGLIINISSIVGHLPPTMLMMYSSTKSFMQRFTYGLQLECQSYPGIVIQDVAPGFVATKLSMMKGRAIPQAINPEDFVRQAFRTIGNLPSTHGAVVHSIFGFFLSLPPEWLKVKLMSWASEKAKYKFEHEIKDK